MDSVWTWHHGLVADWWAEFNTAGPELDYFGRFIETGQPALDAGCGSGCCCRGFAPGTTSTDAMCRRTWLPAAVTSRTVKG